MKNSKHLGAPIRLEDILSPNKNFPSLLEICHNSLEQIQDKNHKIDEYYMLLREIYSSEDTLSNNFSLKDAYDSISFDIWPLLDLDIWQRLICISLLSTPASMNHFKLLLILSKEDPMTILANLFCLSEAQCPDDNNYLKDLEKTFKTTIGMDEIKNSFENSLNFINYIYTHFKNYYDLYAIEFSSHAFIDFSEYINHIDAERILANLRSLNFALKRVINSTDDLSD